MSQPRVVLIYTRDGERTARDLQSKVAPAHCLLAAVADASDFTSVLLRCGRAQPSFDVAVCLGSVEPAIERFLSHNITNASTAVGLPVVLKLGYVADVSSLADRVLRAAGGRAVEGSLSGSVTRSVSDADGPGDHATVAAVIGAEVGSQVSRSSVLERGS